MAEINDGNYVRVPWFPKYNEARHLYPIIDGIEKRLFTGLISTFAALRGTPQNTVDWTNPDAWIPERLKGAEAQLALHIWKKSNHNVNPRYIDGYWNMARTYALLDDLPTGILYLTEYGKDFIKNERGETERLIDEKEGLVKILSLVAEAGLGKRADFLLHWAEFLHANSTSQSESVVKDTLQRRLANLTQRSLVNRIGNAYEITPSGLEYLAEMQTRIGPNPTVTPNRISELYKLADEQKHAVRESFSEYLHQMDPFDFEYLIKLLLEELGYQNVEVTSQTNDKGVDLRAEIEVGITSVTEVIQVKRFGSNVQRRVLDELRGSLHRFNANRGTIITTSNFSKGAKDAAIEFGAAPIQLIDGEELINQLFEKNIGIKRKPIELFELDLDSITHQLNELMQD